MGSVLFPKPAQQSSVFKRTGASENMEPLLQIFYQNLYPNLRTYLNLLLQYPRGTKG